MGGVGLVALGGGIGYVTTHRRQVRDAVRYMDKYLFNRFALTFAGRQGNGYSVIYHTGRKSGKTYATPIVAVPTSTGFLIPLPYGAETDWCRNVRHAEGAVLKQEAALFILSQPEIVNEAFAKPLLKTSALSWFHLVGVRSYLHVRAEMPSQQQEVTDTETEETAPAHA